MNILIHYRHFPVAMGRYFHWGFEDLGHTVYSVGTYSAGKIPWGDSFYYPAYKMPPDYVLPDYDVSLQEVIKKIDFKPDLVFQAGDTQYLTGPSPITNAVLATDPHAVDYTERRRYADIFFNMQDFYKEEKDVWIPYAYSPYIHRFLGGNEQDKYDIVFSGLQYEHRLAAMLAFKKAGLKTRHMLGAIYDDYTELYNKSKIAFCYASKQDLPARFWEGLAMKRLVLTNRVPDLKKLDFVEGEDYVAFDTIEEAVEKALYYATHKQERESIAESGYLKVRPHTYQQRCQQILSSIETL